jgi:hypothetical protein
MISIFEAAENSFFNKYLELGRHPGMAILNSISKSRNATSEILCRNTKAITIKTICLRVIEAPSYAGQSSMLSSLD